MSRRKKNSLQVSKRPKVVCEVCGESDKSVLHRHHIVEQTELNSTNHDYNTAIVCANCHNKIHAGSLQIIGIWPGTRPPTGRILVFKLNGVCNFPALENETPPYAAKAPSIKWSPPYEKYKDR